MPTWGGGQIERGFPDICEDNGGGVFHVDDDDDKAPWASTDVVLVGVAQSRVTQAEGVSLIIGVIVTMIVAIVIVVVMIVKYWL